MLCVFIQGPEITGTLLNCSVADGHDAVSGAAQLHITAKVSDRRVRPGVGGNLAQCAVAAGLFQLGTVRRLSRYLTQNRYAGLSTLELKENDMGFGRGILLWLLGIPIPIILLLALFWHH
jgi:hypothetical protein